MDRKEIFALYLDDYFAEMESLSYRDLKRRQDGLFASLGFGAAGVAYALWYGGVVRRDASLLQAAERFAGAAVRGQNGARAFVSSTSEPGDSVPTGSYLHGRAGLPFVQTLVAGARRDPRGQERAIVRFLALCREPAAGPALYTGGAGCLAASALLLHETGDRRLRELAEELVAGLANQAIEEDGAVTWDGLHGSALAHGRAGVYLALFLASAAAGSPLPPWLGAATEALLRDALADPLGFCPREVFYAWLCNGFSGLVLLAVRAYEALGEPFFLTAARDALRLALKHPPSRPDLCCGRAGSAFVCLAMARIDPQGPWRSRAEDLALSTLLCERDDWAVAGLYGGEAAIPCLVLALREGIDAGPPGLDLVGPLAG